MKVYKSRILLSFFIVLLLCFTVQAQGKVLTEEDILLAELNIVNINKLDATARENYWKKEIGIDPRTDQIIEEAYVCDDICPGYGSVYLRYKDVSNNDECMKFGEVKVSPGWHGYAGCMPLPVKMNIILKSGANIENVRLLDKTDFFLRVGKYVKNQVDLEGRNRFPVYDNLSIFLNDIGSIKTISGQKLDRFQDDIDIPPVLNNIQEQAKIYFKAGVSLMEINADEAIFLFQKVIELDPKFLEPYYKLSALYDRRGPFGAKEIIPLFEKLIGLSPKDANAYYVLGVAYRTHAFYADQSKFNHEYASKAVEMFEKAVSLKPDFADAYEQLGRSYQEKKDYPKAIKAYEKWIAITKPEGVKAEIAYNALNSCKSSLANSFWVKGSQLRRDGKYDEAIVELQKALSEYPGYPEALYTLGLTYRDKGDIKNAIATFEKFSVIEGGPWGMGSYDARAFKQLGFIFKKLEDYTKARDYFLKAIDAYKRRNSAEGIAKIEKILRELPK